jgi:hypothetical protein
LNKKQYNKARLKKYNREKSKTWNLIELFKKENNKIKINLFKKSLKTLKSYPPNPNKSEHLINLNSTTLNKINLFKASKSIIAPTCLIKLSPLSKMITSLKSISTKSTNIKKVLMKEM